MKKRNMSHCASRLALGPMRLAFVAMLTFAAWSAADQASAQCRVGYRGVYAARPYSGYRAARPSPYYGVRPYYGVPQAAYFAPTYGYRGGYATRPLSYYDRRAYSPYVGRTSLYYGGLGGYGVYRGGVSAGFRF